LELEKAKVNLPTVVTIVGAAFGLYFFLAALIAAALVNAKLFALDLDIDRDRDVIEMYRFQIANDIATSQAPARIEELQEKIIRRTQQRDDIIRGL
jgi:hypothetical protein